MDREGVRSQVSAVGVKVPHKTAVGRDVPAPHSNVMWLSFVLAMAVVAIVIALERPSIGVSAVDPETSEFSGKPAEREALWTSVRTGGQAQSSVLPISRHESETAQAESAPSFPQSYVVPGVVTSSGWPVSNAPLARTPVRAVSFRHPGHPMHGD
ncbi:MAG: hypothetical protein ACT4PZ_16655 [Panacagrimonas sp.]